MSRGVSRLVALAAIGAVTVTAGCTRRDAGGFTRAQADETVRAHNAWRRRAGVPSLRWAPDLAARAEAPAGYLAAHGCVIEHAPSLEDVGENLYHVGPLQTEGRNDAKFVVTATQVVDAWGAESADYSPANDTCARDRVSEAMLAQAHQRVVEHDWQNVELVQADAARFEFPAKVDGIVSTYALTLIPDCAQVIRNGCAALAAGGRWVVLDMAWPAIWPVWWRHVLFFLAAYGVTGEVIRRRPWAVVWQTMQLHLSEVRRQQFWMGFFYLAVGRQANRR